MNDNLNPIWKTIDGDQEMIPDSRRLLSEHGFMNLYERVPGLYSSMMREAEQVSRERPELFRLDKDGKEHLNWNCVIRILLAQSAGMQFLYAMGHRQRQ
ncbi:MAG: hypothetical protein GY854_09395 [Deltaproteobacteria bacterium]|nr:hypothetical protein [Deltaproteobacteria bacterium]